MRDPKNMDHYTIEPYKDLYRNQLLTIWESAVLATHDFLDKNDFKEIRSLVHSINFNGLDVYCIVKNHSVHGFAGVAGNKIEMLFIDPQFFGQGLGKRLITFAIHELKATRVDVNEQNTKAVAFYHKMGFKVYERTDTDDQGKPYPLLRMRV